MISKNESMGTWQPGYPDPYYPQTPLPNIPWYPHTGTGIQFPKEKLVTTPELYSEDLDILKTLMARLPTMAGIAGVTEIEIRVRIHEEEIWAVIGYGEAGDPCLLRFEP